MTISTTDRFGLTRWSSDSDALTRTQIDDAHEKIELFLAKMLFGNSIPSIGLSTYARTLFLNQTNNRIYYYTTDNSSGEWISIETDVIPSTIAENKGDVIVATGPNSWGIKPVGSINQILAMLDNAKNVGWSTLLQAKGDLLTLNDGVLTRIPSQQNSMVLHANSSSTGGLSWEYVGSSSLSSASVTTPKISDSSITSQKIVDRNITTAKINNSAVTEIKLADSSVITSAIANDAVATAKIQNSAVTADKLGASSVVSSKLQDLSVTSEKIAQSAVTSPKLANGSVTSAKVADNSVSSLKIAASGVATINIADNAVSEQKILNSSVVTSGIANLAATSVKLADLSVTGAKISHGSVTAGVLVDGAVTTVKIGTGQVTGPKVADLAIVNAKIADNAITTIKIGEFALSALKFASNSVGNSNLRKSVSASVIGNSLNSIEDPADITAVDNGTALRRSGNFLAFGKIQTQGFADLSISSTAILDGSIVDRNVSDTPGISLSKLKTGPLPSNVFTGTSNYVASSVTYPKLNFDQNILGVGIWLDWTPVVYHIPVSNPPRTATISFPGQIMPTAVYTVNSCKYLKINNLCLVNMYVSFPGSPAHPSYGQQPAVISFSLPFAPLTSDGMIVGTSTIGRIDYDPTPWYNDYTMSTMCPIVWKNLLTFSSKDDMNFNRSAMAKDEYITLVSAAKTPGQSTQEDLLSVLGGPSMFGGFGYSPSIIGQVIRVSVAYEVAV